MFAASSFNFAMDQYQPTVRNVKTPSNLRQSSHQNSNQSGQSIEANYIDWYQYNDW